MCWPLILFNYNLPPEDQFHISNIISLGIILGPKKPVNMDSFLWPLVEEMLELVAGVIAFDLLSLSAFVLHAYIIIVFGDIPAVLLLMQMKGHNGLVPCCFCKIQGLKVPSPRATTHYVPLHQANHPTVQVITDSSTITVYNSAALPYHSHKEIHAQGKHINTTLVKVRCEALAKEYGVKGCSILFKLSSLTFPTCFPYDFMHLIWENVVKNLILLWTGNFKGLDEGSGCYSVADG
jgi:Transposase family tnp2